MTKEAPESKSFVPEVPGVSTSHSHTTHASVHRNGSWGAIISIAIILTMVIVVAFYSWGKRITEQRAVQAQIQSTN